MTISFKTGTWTSRTSTGTDVITGVGFTPKIIIIFSTADFQADGTFDNDFHFRFGCAVDTTAANQKSFDSASFDTADPSATERTFTSSSVHLRSVSGPSVKGAISAIGTDGFTMNWTLMDGTAHHLNYICIGGTDITNVKTGGITTPTSAQSQATTGVGFQPDFVMLWGTLNTSDDTANTGTTYGLGFANSSTKQAALSGASGNNLATMSTKRYQRSDNTACFVALDPQTPTTIAIAGSLSSMNADGFTISWSPLTFVAQSTKLGYLAVKGGGLTVGKTSSPTSAPPASQSVTGLSGAPVGVILASVCNVASTTVAASNRISFGGGSSSANMRCVWAGDLDAAGAAVTACVQKSTKAITMYIENATASSSGLTAEASITSMDATGFTLNWSQDSASALEYIYVAVGAGAAAGQNITRSLTETITIGSPTPTRTKGRSVAKTLSETVTVGSPTPTKTAAKVRALPAETLTLTSALDSVAFIGGKKHVTKALPEVLTLTQTLTRTVTGRKDIQKSLTETLHIADALNYVGKTRHTGDPGYILPLRPRIKIYAFTDSSYSTPLYSYDAIAEGQGGTDKPIALRFDDSSTTTGTFSLQIDNSTDTYDLDQFARGNRITIDCSKDGNTWFAAFHGLVRSATQKVFGPNNRIIYVEGYSYLIRLNERVLSVKKQAALIGANYDRTDSTMFSDTLIHDLLTNDADYVKTVDDTQLYSINKSSNITASPIDDWIPRLDVELNTVNEAINSILEYSQSVLTVDYTNDQLVLFNPDRVPSGGANAFLVTDNPVLDGDSSLNTMYPIADYTYEISYDFADSGNRLITAIGNVDCPPVTIPGAAGNIGATLFSNDPSGGSVTAGTIYYNQWSVNNGTYSGPTAGPPANSAIGMQLNAGAAEIGNQLFQIDMVFTKQGVACSGTLRVGIFKNSDGSFLQVASVDASTIPNDTNYYGYSFSDSANTYVCQQGDIIGADCSGLSSKIAVGYFMGTDPTYPVGYKSGSTWFSLPSATGVAAALTCRTYQRVVDNSNYGTIQLNGTTVKRVSILINAGNPLIGKNLGRISISLRRSSTTPNNTYWVGIRKADNTFIYFGGGIFSASSIPFSTLYGFTDFDKLDNHYQLVAGDRISIETDMTTGYIEIECSKDSPTTQTTQTYNGTTYSTSGIVSFNLGVKLYQSTAQPDVTVDQCGGLPETRDADPLLTIASDCNMTKRIGMVEQVVTNVPPHVKNFQSMNEFMFNKLYQMARPRFTFDYPSVTLPGIMPKAGDICAHISKKAGIGVRRGVVQTGVITQVTYDFGQDSDSVLGLRRLSIQTNGILRGSY